MSAQVTTIVLLSAIWTGLTIGNFGWQFFGAQAWAVALERSFFQLVAVVAVGLADAGIVWWFGRGPTP